MKTMVSGIKPTGRIHLGNYIGALRHFANYQDDYKLYVFVANLHCITTYQDPITLNQYLKEMVGLYLACGVDPKKTTIFLQSDVMEHSQLGFIMCCNTYMGELNRMTQYKDKQLKGEKNLTGGIYTYPSLMAADILLYDADYVPVGEDQKQHVELTRDLAIRFNNRYSPTFKVPEPLISKVGARIMSLQDPTKKMSKSDESNKGCIYILDDLNVSRKKIMSAKTDSLNCVHFDPVNQAGVSNLMQIYSSLTGHSFAEIEETFKGEGYGTFKKAVADVVCDAISEIQANYQNIIENDLISHVLKEGALEAKKIASLKLKEVESKLGIAL